MESPPKEVKVVICPPPVMGTITAVIAGMMVVPMPWARALLVEAANLWLDQSNKRVVGYLNSTEFSRDQSSLRVPSNRTTAGDNQSLSPDPQGNRPKSCIRANRAGIAPEMQPLTRK